MVAKGEPFAAWEAEDQRESQRLQQLDRKLRLRAHRKRPAEKEQVRLRSFSPLCCLLLFVGFGLVFVGFVLFVVGACCFWLFVCCCLLFCWGDLFTFCILFV